MFKKITAFLCLLMVLQVQAQEQQQQQEQRQQPEWIYHTQKGDTIWDICLKYTNKRGCWITLTQYNNVSNDRAVAINTPIRIPVGWLKKPFVVGQVAYVTGSAEYSLWNDKQFTRLTSGQDVHLGAKIHTAANSFVKVVLHKTNEVLIKENSELLLHKFSSENESELNEELILEKGAADAEVNSGKVKNRFIIKTPAAIAAVRGTEFRINSHGDHMRGEVLEGQIDVKSEVSSQSVPAGFGVAATKGKAVQPPRELPPKPIMTKQQIKMALPAKVEWQALSGIDQYQTSLLDSAGAILAIDTVKQNWAIYDALDKGCYSVKVHGIDNEGFHGVDAHAQLCVIDHLPAVVLSDSTDLKDEDNNLVLSWQGIAEANRYKIQISEDAEFTQIAKEIMTSDTQVEFPKLEGKTVYIRVIAMDSLGRVSAPSDTLEYTDRSFLLQILAAVLLLGISFR